MSTIREDFEGSVTVHHGGRAHSLVAGDEVPEGARVDASLLEGGADDPANASADPLSSDELERLELLGIGKADAQATDPSFCRAFLDGYDRGYEDGIAFDGTLTPEGEAAPSDPDAETADPGAPNGQPDDAAAEAQRVQDADVLGRTVPQVLEHFAGASDEDVARLQDLERASAKPRAGVLEYSRS